MGDQMIPIIFYCIVSTIVTALFNRLGLKWYDREFSNLEGPPKFSFACVYGLFWPITLFFGGPVVLCYKLVNKAIDKFMKV